MRHALHTVAEKQIANKCFFKLSSNATENDIGAMKLPSYYATLLKNWNWNKAEAHMVKAMS